jgi:hypothetical protein
MVMTAVKDSTKPVVTGFVILERVNNHPRDEHGKHRKYRTGANVVRRVSATPRDLDL